MFEDNATRYYDIDMRHYFDAEPVSPLLLLKRRAVKLDISVCR